MALLNRDARAAPQLIVRSLSRRNTLGRITFGNLQAVCALGRSGISLRKREGDGATPAGNFELRKIFYRPDRGLRPRSGLRVIRLRKESGWCDAPDHRDYNRYVRHPFCASAEALWRSDDLYDLIVVIGHNDRPRIAGAGSAIFMHVARGGFKPTEGCVALRSKDLMRFAARMTPSTRIRICP